MKVIKFGGTSVGSVESLRNVKAIIDSYPQPVVVVVSALGGITDKLISTARAAAKGNKEYKELYGQIVERHHDIIANVVPEDKKIQILEAVNTLLGELSDLYRGLELIRDLSQRTLDVIVSYGERMSSLIVTSMIKGAWRYDSREFIKTVSRNGSHVVDNRLTEKLVRHTLGSLDFNVAVVPGFISTDEEGHVTNLGRGGSDYTAAILAAALDAEILEIWTDVDGFLTADPRVVKSTKVIDKLSFTQAIELCNFGAKVVYPPTIFPVYHKNIPIAVKNTFNPEAPGSRICEKESNDGKQRFTGVSSISDTCLITVSGLSAASRGGVNARIFNTLARNGVSLLLISQDTADDSATSFVVKENESAEAMKVLREEFVGDFNRGHMADVSAIHQLATVAVVGENLHRSQTPAVTSLFEALDREDLRVDAISAGNSESTISFTVEQRRLVDALDAVHAQLFC